MDGSAQPSAAEIAWQAGKEETAETLNRWRSERFRILLPWALGALGIACALLLTTLVISLLGRGTDTLFYPIAVRSRVGIDDFVHVLLRNLSVLLLHTLVCFASYLAQRSLPLQVVHKRGLDRWVHEHASGVALAAVAGITMWSLGLQAWVLGHDLIDAARTLGMSRPGVLLRLLPHAVPELTAVFLPLAATLWIGYHRRWNEGLAASLLCFGVALPVVVAGATLETYAAHLLF